MKHPAEINEIFDTISYAKGASILRMLFNYITPTVGYRALHKYLTKFAYKNTVTEDLWESLGAVRERALSRLLDCVCAHKRTRAHMHSHARRDAGLHALARARVPARVAPTPTGRAPRARPGRRSQASTCAGSCARGPRTRASRS